MEVIFNVVGVVVMASDGQRWIRKELGTFASKFNVHGIHSQTPKCWYLKRFLSHHHISPCHLETKFLLDCRGQIRHETYSRDTVTRVACILFICSSPLTSCILPCLAFLLRTLLGTQYI